MEQRQQNPDGQASAEQLARIGRFEAILREAEQAHEKPSRRNDEIQAQYARVHPLSPLASCSI